MKRFQRTMLFISALLLMTTGISADPERLSAGMVEGDPADLAMRHIQSHRQDLGLTEADLADVAILDRYLHRDSGVTHIYLQQRLGGIEVEGGLIQVGISRDGRLVNLDSGFVTGLAGRVNATSPTLSGRAAILKAAEHFGLGPLVADLALLRLEGDPDRWAIFAGKLLSRSEIPVHLVYQPMADGSVRLAWQVHLDLVDARHQWSVRIDALSGELISITGWTNEDPDPNRTANAMAKSGNLPQVGPPGFSRTTDHSGKGDLSVGTRAVAGSVDSKEPIGIFARISCKNFRPGSDGDCTFVNVKMNNFLTSFPPTDPNDPPPFTVIGTEGCLEDPGGVPTCTLPAPVTQQSPGQYEIKICVDDETISSVISCPKLSTSRPVDFSIFNNTSCVILAADVLQLHLCADILADGFSPADTGG